MTVSTRKGRANKTSVLKSVSRGYSKLCIAAVALGGLLWFTSSQHDQHFETGGAHVATILTTSGLIGLVSFWLVAAFFFFMRAMFRSIDAATRPVPSPQQIAVEFRAAYGRDPTWEEVNAIHAILTRQRNEAAAGTAIKLGCLALGAHLAEGIHHTNGRSV